MAGTDMKYIPLILVGVFGYLILKRSPAEAAVLVPPTPGSSTVQEPALSPELTPFLQDVAKQGAQLAATAVKALSSPKTPGPAVSAGGQVKSSKADTDKKPYYVFPASAQVPRAHITQDRAVAEALKAMGRERWTGGAVTPEEFKRIKKVFPYTPGGKSFIYG